MTEGLLFIVFTGKKPYFMNQVYKNTQQLFHYLVRVSKKDSALLYFQLEANDGLSFYSTTEESLGSVYRDIELKGSIEYRPQIQNLFESLKNEFPIQILKDEIIIDA